MKIIVFSLLIHINFADLAKQTAQTAALVPAVANQFPPDVDTLVTIYKDVLPVHNS